MAYFCYSMIYIYLKNIFTALNSYSFTSLPVTHLSFLAKPKQPTEMCGVKRRRERASDHVWSGSDWELQVQ